ncbi:MAG: sulfurtransferase FdhD [Legionellales bacterium]|nr:sulfurtransferase FdhD [Legionellales bacterium]|tara:strand:+ start:405 stop:1265 length:861 start_codon:yes stop_codon:yes gene_type:complete
MPSTLPMMTNAGLSPTKKVLVKDEYKNTRELNIAEERPLTIYIDSFEIVTLMTLGTEPELLALGYIKNQELISDLNEIQSVQVDWDVNAAAITTKNKRADIVDKLGSRIVTTGCGQGTIFHGVMEQLEKLKIKSRNVKQSSLYMLLKNLNASNDVYKNAGAVHGCALCIESEPLVFIEDVGRHNAVDAIAGKMWLENIPGEDKIFYTTGRLTSEMIIKVAQMKIPILLSRSGITQMGLSLAQELNITLLSRVKNKHFLVYNGYENIEFDTSLPPKQEVANTINKGN